MIIRRTQHFSNIQEAIAFIVPLKIPYVFKILRNKSVRVIWEEKEQN